MARFARRHRGPVLAVLTAVWLAISAAASAMADPVQFDIAAQSMPQALKRFAAQAHVQLLFDYKAVEALKTPAVRGRLEATDALGILLRGTGFTFQQVNDHTIAISRASPTSDARSGSESSYPDPDGSNSPSPGPLQLAQATPEQAQGANAVGSDEKKTARRRKEEELQEIVVTGSHIHGSAPIGSTVRTIDREEIAQSGYASVPDILKTLPQNFAGGVGVVNSPASNDSTAGNDSFATGVNLRGVGADSTLILIDGHRQATSGLNGTFVDVSSIPATAIERIEVLTDGASAIYGADAIGGVVNFILRKDFTGAETNARLGTYAGAATEGRVGQLFGTSWATGNVMLAYEFLDQDHLPMSSRTRTASSDLTPYGGTNFSSIDSAPGNVLNPNTFQPEYAIPAGQNGHDLTVGKLLPGVVNYYNNNLGVDLLPAQKLNSLFVGANQRLGERFEIFAEGSYRHREADFSTLSSQEVVTVPSSNPYYINPYGGLAPVNVAYNFVNDLGNQLVTSKVETYTATVGTTAHVTNAWSVTASGSYAREGTESITDNVANTIILPTYLTDSDPTTAFNPFGALPGVNNPATLNALRTDFFDSYHSLDRSVDLTADGSLLSLPAGDAKLAIGGEYRTQSLNVTQLFPGGSQSEVLGRDITAGFAEVAVPLISGRNAVPAARDLALSVAERFERYSDFGNTRNPKIGLRWSPVTDFQLRGTWGTSFKAPNLPQLSATLASSPAGIIPLQTPTGFENALVLTGNNPTLSAEKAHIWTVGFDYSSEAARGFKVEATYYSISYDSRIAQPGPVNNPFNILLAPGEWTSLINSSPTQAQLTAICTSPLYLDTGIPCNTANVSAIVDLRLQNIASTLVRGADLTATQRFDLSHGSLTLGVAGTFTSTFAQRVSGTAPMDSMVDTIGNVPKIRFRASGVWSYGHFNLASYLNYVGSYEDNISVPNRPIGSWTTLDASVGYRMESNGKFLEGAEIRISAVNALNHMPPFANVGYPNADALGFDAANANLYGRILSAELTVHW